MPFARPSVVTFGVVGFLVFALAFFASWANPGFVEQIAKQIIRFQVEEQVHEKIEAIDSHFLAKDVNLTAYQRSLQSDQAQAFTGISSTWGKQVTFVSQLNQDGTRKISVTADDPTPPASKIG